MDVATDLYENDLIEYKTYDSIRGDYEYSVKKDKNKDVLKLECKIVNFKIKFLAILTKYLIINIER